MSHTLLFTATCSRQALSESIKCWELTELFRVPAPPALLVARRGGSCWQLCEISDRELFFWNAADVTSLSKGGCSVIPPMHRARRSVVKRGKTHLG